MNLRKIKQNTKILKVKESIKEQIKTIIKNSRLKLIFTEDRDYIYIRGKKFYI